MREPETILLTGASGFLGSHLVKALLSANYQILAYKRATSDLWRVQEIAEKIQWYDTQNLTEPFRQHRIDHVIHTATCYGRNNELASDLLTVNVLFPLQLFELADKHQVQTFINTDTALHGKVNAYALSKKQFNEWLLQARTEVKIINIKLEHFYGAGDSVNNFITYVIDQCWRNVNELALTLGEQQRDFVYITDVIQAYKCILKSHTQLLEHYNDIEIGSGRAVSIREVVELIAKLLDSKTKLMFGALPYRENEIMISAANLAKMQVLGWKPEVSLKDGIKNTIAHIGK